MLLDNWNVQNRSIGIFLVDHLLYINPYYFLLLILEKEISIDILSFFNIDGV